MTFVQKSLIALLLIIPCSMANANSISEDNSDPKVGDVLVVNLPSSEDFQHVFFPERDEIRRRTGSVNYRDVLGVEVMVSKVERKGDGTVHVTLKPIHGKKFFGHWNSVKANFTAAMEAGELNWSY